jgi:hypothetical protein
MEDKQRHSAPSKDLHESLETVADGLGLNPEKSKSWPKASNWLWKRMREILPLLESHEIRAFQDRESAEQNNRRVVVLEKLGGQRRGVASMASKEGSVASKWLAANDDASQNEADTYAESVPGGEHGEQKTANVGVASSNEFGESGGGTHEHGVPLHHPKNTSHADPHDAVPTPQDIAADKILKQLLLEQGEWGRPGTFDAPTVRAGLKEGRYGTFGDFDLPTIEAAIELLVDRDRGEIRKICWN